MKRAREVTAAADHQESARVRTFVGEGRLARLVPIGLREMSSCIALGGVSVLTEEEARRDPLGAWWRATLEGAEPSAWSDCRGPHGGGDFDARAMRRTSSAAPTRPREERPALRVVDLFAGVGGFLVGAGQLAAENGLHMRCELAVDIDSDALAVHRRNHRTRRVMATSTATLVDYRIRGSGAGAEFVYAPELLDEELASACEGVDLVTAGPPCQGHSNLNNRSRRNDRRNLLYLTVPAFAVACRARSIAIENVASVVHDTSSVVETTRALLVANGYLVTDGVFAADEMGWPQTRRRHFLIARRPDAPGLGGPMPQSAVRALLTDERPRSVEWAIGDQQGLSLDAAMHVLPDYTEANRERIAWLFDNGEHDLALAERPECHQEGTSYGAVYGRMHADRPAPTITTGFMTPGRGRYVHPYERRTLSAAEAARLQGFPDAYDFRPDHNRRPSRAQLAKWIGDAVTAPLGYAAALSALAPMLGR